jgi:hypothetical protein
VFGFKVNLKAVFSSEISRAMGTTMWWGHHFEMDAGTGIEFIRAIFSVVLDQCSVVDL